MIEYALWALMLAQTYTDNYVWITNPARIYSQEECIIRRDTFLAETESDPFTYIRGIKCLPKGVKPSPLRVKLESKVDILDRQGLLENLLKEQLEEQK